MPIKATVNRETKCVHSICTGVVTAEDMLAYQAATWNQTYVSRGYPNDRDLCIGRRGHGMAYEK